MSGRHAARSGSLDFGAGMIWIEGSKIMELCRWKIPRSWTATASSLTMPFLREG